MAEKERDDAHSQQFAQAIARLAGDSDPGEQNHGIQRDDHHATDKSLRFCDDGEDKIIVLARLRQEAEGVLLAVAPAFAKQTAGANGNQRLPHVVRVVELLLAQLLPLARPARCGAAMAA